MKNISKLSFVFIGLLLLAVGCVDDDKPKPQPPENATLTLSFEHYFNEKPLVFLKDTHQIASGNNIVVTRISYLLSNFYLVKSAGDTLRYADQFAYIEVKDGKTKVVLENLPQGEYTQIGFTLGLDSSINHGDPSQYPINHALNATNNGLHWTWASGYIFIALEGGLTDTDEGYSHHLSGTNQAVDYVFPTNFSKTNEAMNAIVRMNYAEIYANPNIIEIKENKAIHVPNTAMGNKMFENLVDVFTLISVK